ncbi:hypothetical protein L207DRAFT_149808 [Hyaloscypha variabilis F]|uniref:Uncharacterized protein n=1 Tax=Hyaloscypha variabilis (strain UAMH 11265 / GT02V1 / F) TaxID=1149755 RepID=A0A2J6S877_HYAVF|nr:hypothetical protein L207DRAFT_149808 [Hyaloscypha variabilis F]
MAALCFCPSAASFPVLLDALLLMSIVGGCASSQTQTLSVSYSTHTTMPRLDHDGQMELQALVAIRQTLEPLIAKRILDDTDKITSLAVSNSRDLFKFELDQILLNLKTGQDLQPEDYASFLEDLHRLLQLLEGLIDEKVLHPSVDLDLVEHQDHIATLPQEISTSTVVVNGLASLIYPKLAALMKTASDEPDSSNLSKLVRLPEIEEDCKRAEQTLTDFNAKNLSRSNTAGRDEVGGINVGDRSRHKPATKSKSVSHQLESIRQSQECLSGILNALRNNIRDSECPDCHIAKLQIRDPGNNSSNNELQYKLFVTCSTVQDKWQETNCTVVRNL